MDTQGNELREEGEPPHEATVYTPVPAAPRYVSKPMVEERMRRASEFTRLYIDRMIDEAVRIERGGRALSRPVGPSIGLGEPWQGFGEGVDARSGHLGRSSPRLLELREEERHPSQALRDLEAPTAGSIFMMEAGEPRGDPAASTPQSVDTQGDEL